MKKQMMTNHSNVKEIPLLFSTDMVEALLAGTKTETRRTKNLTEINVNPDAYKYVDILHGSYKDGCEYVARFINTETNSPINIKCPWAVGNKIWVKEVWKPDLHFTDLANSRNNLVKVIRYKAGLDSVTVPKEEEKWFDNLTKDGRLTYKSSMFLRRKFARIFLEITEVKIERLHDITQHSAIWEGIEREFDDSGNSWYRNYLDTSNQPTMFRKDPIKSYQTLWEKINGVGSWETNPYCWVIKLRKL